MRALRVSVWLFLMSLLSALVGCFFPWINQHQKDDNICLVSGGQQVIHDKRGDGTVYQICLFEDNRQCEVQALERGDCPRGGLRITGYITPASRYCVLTGGHYMIKPSESSQEQGYCTRNGITCDANDYFNSHCLLP